MNCVIDVGGGLRGSYGAGVFDTCMEEGTEFDTCYGVSAGAANCVSFLAGQKERNLKFYTEYAFRKEYMSWGNFFRTGSYLGLDYIYGALSNSDGEYPLDFDRVISSGKTFYVVATNAETGRPRYFTLDDMKQDDYGVIKASSCVPAIDRPYKIDGIPYFDGGLSDPIPIRHALAEGYDKIVLVLTRPRDNYRKPGNDIRIARGLFRRWPNTARALYRRASYYNRSLEIAKQYEKEGRVLIIAPKSIGSMKTLTRSKESIWMMYEEGRRDGKAIRAYLAEEKTAPKNS